MSIETMKHRNEVIVFCLPITINNPVKASFSKKKYAISIQTGTTQIENWICLLQRLFLIGF